MTGAPFSYEERFPSSERTCYLIGGDGILRHKNKVQKESDVHLKLKGLIELDLEGRAGFKFEGRRGSSVGEE